MASVDLYRGIIRQCGPNKPDLNDSSQHTVPDGFGLNSERSRQGDDNAGCENPGGQSTTHKTWKTTLKSNQPLSSNATL
jgi:hypothetical protein